MIFIPWGYHDVNIPKPAYIVYQKLVTKEENGEELNKEEKILCKYFERYKKAIYEEDLADGNVHQESWRLEKIRKKNNETHAQSAVRREHDRAFLDAIRKRTALRQKLEDIASHIVKFAIQNNIIKESELNIELLPPYLNYEGEDSYRKSKPKKAKSTFRSGNSQGKDMIRNMNRMTGTTLKRFQK